jgi:hypothetical protein
MPGTGAGSAGVDAPTPTVRWRGGGQFAPSRSRCLYTHKCCTSYAYPSISIYHLCVQGRHVCMGYMYLCISPPMSSTFYLIAKQNSLVHAWSYAEICPPPPVPLSPLPPLSRNRHRNTDHTLTTHAYSPTRLHIYTSTQIGTRRYLIFASRRILPASINAHSPVLACFSISLRAPNLASSNFPALVTNPFS